MRQFSPNARRLIASQTTRSFGRGVYSAIFNLYLLTLGYSKTFLGGLLSLGALTMAIGALTLGPYVQRVGTRNAFILGCLISLTVAVAQVGYPAAEVLLIGAVLGNVGSALFSISFSPFMTENSTPYERTHLFGASQSFTIMSSFLGSTLAGYLPGWFALTLNLPLDSAPTFQLALTLWVIPLAIGIPPLALIRERESQAMPTSRVSGSSKRPRTPEPEGSKLVVLQFALVGGIIGLGAGFIVPYLNVFFWEFYDLPTPMVGIITALGQLSVATGVFLAPVLSSRIGKVWTVVVTQALSLPFLVMLALVINPFVAIACYLLRAVLMNAGQPVNSNLRMELVPSSWRPNMSAINISARQLAWSLSTQITGPLYDQGVYLLPFWFTLACYTGSTILYALFFHDAERRLAAKLAAQAPPEKLVDASSSPNMESK